jgi:hypothetical protein
MNYKKQLSVLSFTIFLFSCSTPELDSAKKKLEESKCKVEHAQFVLENGMNTMLLAKKLGLEKELENYNKIQTDSTISCDSIERAWKNISDLVYEKSK